MDCAHVQDLISAYHDDELPEGIRQQVTEHLHRCNSCAEELGHFERMSQLAAQLESPDVPPEVWDRIESELRRPSSAPDVIGAPLWRNRVVGGIAIAAAVLILVGLGVWFSTGRDSHDLASAHANEVDLAPYARQFYRDADAAQRELLTQYAHRITTPSEAEQEVKYRPVIANSLPGGFVRQELRTIKMPCCTCVQAVYRNNKSDHLTTFQQSSDDSFLFEGCAEVTCRCCGIDTRIVQVDGGIAASWQVKGTHVTLIGLRDIQQVVATMASLLQAADENQQ